MSNCLAKSNCVFFKAGVCDPSLLRDEIESCKRFNTDQPVVKPFTKPQPKPIQKFISIFASSKFRKGTL